MDSTNIRISLAAARVNAGYDQKQVAKALNVSLNTVVNWEKGRTEPKTSQARALSELYKLPYDCIIFLPAKAN